MEAKWLGKDWNFSKEIDSTNDWAKREAKNGASNGAVFLADDQTKGKGRRGKNWSNPKGSGLAISFLLRPQIPTDKVSMLTLVMGLSAALAVQELTGLEAKIKWPNDLVLNNKKICGILTEMSVQSMANYSVVVGCGINLNMEEFPKEIKDVATSLFLECGRKIERDTAAKILLGYFETNYEKFLETCDLSGLRETYNSLLINQNREVKIVEQDREFTGISKGIDEMGHLLVETPDKECISVFAGEVSVRGLYGYV